MSRSIIARIATSADGFIARRDGSVDFLNERPRPKGSYGMGEFYRSIDTILWGRKTYDVALEFQRQGVKGAAFDPNVKNYVFSRNPPAAPPPGVEFVSEDVKPFARRLRAVGGKDIWMMGGGELIALIGEGIPLLAPRHRRVPLKLKGVRKFPDGVVHLDYEISRPPPA
ncbi:MAG: dihydrofolate reductase [Acidobacteria bacterium]|nr:MAG: dihydrofolate reductase [Acidobacteriota bacterium]